MPAEMRKRRLMETKMRAIADKWGYEEIRTPSFERAELFTLKSGEGILKELYEFKDKGGRHLALRPELTAPVTRMYVNELKMAPKPTKVCCTITSTFPAYNQQRYPEHIPNISIL
jgi:histidyl-tRNA synthetase